MNLSRTVAVAAALVLMLSLSGCTLVFHVVGSETFYEVDSTGVVNDPIKVDVTLKGLWPLWPDHLVAEIFGVVNPVGTSDIANPADITLANTVETYLYNELSSDEYDFEYVQAEADLIDDEFKVTVGMTIPDWKDSLGPAGASTQVTVEDIPLDALLGENYGNLVEGLKQACSQIPSGTEVETTLGATLRNEERDRLVGDLLIKLILKGSLL